ncbi:MAG: 16S rRNA (cytidine(1402)-2'-O)-methyltransferase, partial [Actinomycetota bacterium]
LRLLARMRRGERVALVADSGTPAISDPGYVIVRACIDEGIPIEVVPGPSAAVAALVASGLPTARFAFEGFLPRKEGERRRRLKDLSADERTFVIFEAPGRLLATLEDLREVLGNRRVAVARELTKVHEEFLRGSIERVVEALAGRELLGEAVLVVEGAAPLPGRLEEAAGMARELVEAGLSSSQAASRAATRFGLQKRAVYQALLE